MTSVLLVSAQRIERDRLRVLARLDLRGVERPDAPFAYLEAGAAKYGAAAWWRAEDEKQLFRLDYHKRTLHDHHSFAAHDAMKRRAFEFWAEYEDVNRRLLPADPVYAAARGGYTLATTTDVFTLSCGASGMDRVIEQAISGEAAASAVARVSVQRSTGGATPTNQTPEKLNSRSPAAASTSATLWTTQPTLTANPILQLGFNAFGGSDRWVPTPGQEIYLVNGEILSVRSASGTSVVSFYEHWEEM